MCLGMLKAMRSHPEYNYVAYRKGIGVVCNKKGGFGEDDSVAEFFDLVYPSWRWYEKQDGIKHIQNNSQDQAPEFYNIMLEKPKGDRDGYDFVFVDAMHKAKYASRICHSCNPNCEAKVTAVDGQYQSGIYTLRTIAEGEKITFDCNFVTESKEEHVAVVCLRGSQKCRGSYLNFSGEGALEKGLMEFHGVFHRHSLLLQACEANFVSQQDLIDLGRAGLGTCLLADLIHMYAYMKCFFRVRDYKTVKSPPVQILWQTILSTADVGGEAGLAMRNSRFTSLIQVPWEAATTMAALFEMARKKYPQHRCLGTRKLINREFVESADGGKFEKVHLGEYEWNTYSEAFNRACNFVSGLVKMGHQLDSRAAIFSDTRVEWIIAAQGCFRHNLTVVTIYASLGEDALVHSLNETQVSTLICDSKQLKKLPAISPKLQSVRHIIYIEDEPVEADTLKQMEHLTTLSFSEVEEFGKTSHTDARLPSSTDTAVIMYTSGSTGLPKGVMITHGNMVATTAAVMTIVPKIGTGDVYLAYLPLAHVFELAAETVMLASGVAIGYGSALTMTDTSNKIKKGTKGDVSVLKPTLMISVPAILDRIRDAVFKKVGEKGGLTKRLFDIAYKRNLGAIEGSWFGSWALERMIWDNVIFKPIRAVLGGRIRFVLCGGAPLSSDTQRFMNICLGVPVGQGYGLTETCAGAAFSEWDDTSVGRVGPPLPCCYVKLVSWGEGGYTVSDSPMPRGEVVVGGYSITKGYFNNEAKTNEVYKVDERGIRWFYTGDIGQFHPDGCLEIIDRKKDIVKLQHGEYVSLGKVESALSTSNYVDNIMVYADPFHNYCVALVVPAHQTLEKWAQSSGINYRNFEELCDNDQAIKEVQQSLSKAAKAARLEKFEIPAKILLLPEPWTPESGLVTAALKLKREQVKTKFKDDLNKLYH